MNKTSQWMKPKKIKDLTMVCENCGKPTDDLLDFEGFYYCRECKEIEERRKYLTEIDKQWEKEK